MNEQPLLSYVTWLALPIETRRKLVLLFNIPRTGEVQVRVGGISKEGNIGGEAIQDGHAAKDLYAITVERMQELLGTNRTDFNALFWDTVSNINELAEGTYAVPKKKSKKTHEEPLEEIE